MSLQTDQCERLIVKALEGNEEATAFLRDLASNVVRSCPVIALADMLRAAIKAQNQWQENN